jgi:YHS domain-containing protein
MAQQRDPVCGMMVDPANAAGESTYGNTTYYFCSENCRQRFEANPTAFIAAGTRSGTEQSGAEQTLMEQHEPPRTTKGGVTSPKFGSAGSGGAEFEPLPEQHEDAEKPTR